MKKIALTSYGVFYLLLIAFSVYGGILVGQYSVASAISTLLSMVYLLGFFGYALQKAIWSATVWRRLFYLLSVATLIQLITAFWAEWTKSLEVILATLFSLPVIYALYQYGKADGVIWLNDKDYIRAAVVDRLFDVEATLVVEKTNGADKITVSVSKDADHYCAKISRINGGKEESFANTFNSSAALIAFIEKYTAVTLTDFEEKYAG